MIRLAIVDDHPLVVDGLVAGLATVSDFELVVTAATVDEARDVLGREDVDVVLLDVRLEGGNGLQVLAERLGRSRSRVLVLSSFTSSQYIAAAARFGAAGFALKTTPLVELVPLIRKVAAGERVFSADQLAKRYVNLSRTERSVVALAMEGLSNKEIGDRLGTSKKAVEAHLSEIFARHGVRGRVEMTLRAAREGWLEIEQPARPRSRRLR